MVVAKEIKLQILSDMLRDHENELKAFHKRVAQFELFAEMIGEKIDSDSFVKYGGSIAIAKTLLPKIRKVVGRLSVTSKSPSWNYNKDHELIVRVAPIDPRFDMLAFTYRTPHKGTRCKVVEHTYTSQSLVCDAR